MPFVKLDCGILNSTLWLNRDPRELFITALLMAEPCEILEPMPQLRAGANSIEETGFVVPPGWYGFVHASGPGIVNRAMMTDQASGLAALSLLGEPDPESRSHDFEGRRLVRVDGGFVVLNYIKYREKDSTTADRSRRWRERQKAKDDENASRVTDTPTRVIRHQAEAEAEGKDQKLCPSPIGDVHAAVNGSDLLGQPMVRSKSKRDRLRVPIPVQVIVDLYHELLPELPKVFKITKARRGQIEQRWRDDLTDLDDWRLYFTRVRSSAFLMGKEPAGIGRSKPFIADLEWLTKEANFSKINEGKYHGKLQTQGKRNR